jgi:hypothetical protein
VRAALAALDRQDGASAALMVEAARSALGDVDERYAGPQLEPSRTRLREASLDLAAAEGTARRDVARARLDLTLWLGHELEWAPAVVAAAPRSLYDPDRLRLATTRIETSTAAR